MIRYPHTTPWSSTIGLAAAVATVATMGIAIVLPAAINVQPGADTAIAISETKPAQATVMLERIDVVAARRSSVDKAAADVAAKQRG